MSSRAAVLTAMFLCTFLALGSEKKADQVATKAIQAIGGIERIRALYSLAYRGEHGEGRHSSEAVMTRMRPNFRLIGCTPKVCDDWGRIVEGFDGQRGWELNWSKQRLIRTTNKAEIAMRCGAQFDPLFINYKRRGFQVEDLGEQTLFGRKLLALEVNPRNGCQTQIYYFDPSTYRLFAARLKMPVHARGELIDTAVVFSDFREVNGVKLPFRAEDRNVANGETLSFTRWKTITPNALDDARIFQPPTVHPEPPTAWTMKLLERAPQLNGTEIRTMYREFRGTKEGRSADMEEDLNWVGYELLKVDRYDLAIPVFQQVILEHPNSPKAYDSLGDGYLQMGDKQQAIAAFEKAVALNPKAVDRAAKLGKLRQQPK